MIYLILGTCFWINVPQFIEVHNPNFEKPQPPKPITYCMKQDNKDRDNKGAFDFWLGPKDEVFYYSKKFKKWRLME